MTEAGEIISFREVEEKVLSLRGQGVILDRDVAELYGVETKRRIEPRSA
ncbi:MAG: ORF6N domain-containing protein [Synergistaceae bacterium]|nr:ORF6N domain-containing protein [Synergistaceae bacterium]